jgi:hypothetical protein
MTSVNCFWCGGAALSLVAAAPAAYAEPVPGSAMWSTLRTAPVADCVSTGAAERGLFWNGKRYTLQSVVTGTGAHKVFFDPKGQPVTDPVLGTKLARAVWVYDHIVADPTERSGNGGELRLRALLNASHSMALYLTSQDLMARVFVRAVAAVVTDGASLAGTAGGLTKGLLRSNLANLHRLRMAESEIGLQDALSGYKRLQWATRRMSPDTINVIRALNAFDIYARAYVFEVGYGPLLSALLPKTGRELVVKAVNSAGGELLATIAPGSDEVLTWAEVNRTRVLIEEATATIPGMRAQAQALAGAIRYIVAAKAAVEQQANEAVRACAGAAE